MVSVGNSYLICKDVTKHVVLRRTAQLIHSKHWGCWFVNWLDLESKAHGCSTGCSVLRLYGGNDPFSLVNTTKSPLLITNPKHGPVSTALAMKMGEWSRNWDVLNKSLIFHNGWKTAAARCSNDIPFACVLVHVLPLNLLATELQAYCRRAST